MVTDLGGNVRRRPLPVEAVRAVADRFFRLVEWDVENPLLAFGGVGGGVPSPPGTFSLARTPSRSRVSPSRSLARGRAGPGRRCCRELLSRWLWPRFPGGRLWRRRCPWRSPRVLGGFEVAGGPYQFRQGGAELVVGDAGGPGGSVDYSSAASFGGRWRQSSFQLRPSSCLRLLIFEGGGGGGLQEVDDRAVRRRRRARPPAGRGGHPGEPLVRPS